MAQWIGQLSGRTHESHIQETEETLRHAVEAFRLSPIEARSQKTKAVRNLAKRLLSVRIRRLKARLSVSLDRGMAEAMASRAKGIASLQRRIEATRTQGVPGILAEFGIENLDTYPT